MPDIDFENFPSDIEIPAQLVSSDAEDLAQQNIVFQFCLLFMGRSVQTVPVAAPSPEEAALTMRQFVDQINAGLERMGYPPNCCSMASGACVAA